MIFKTFILCLSISAFSSCSFFTPDKHQELVKRDKNIGGYTVSVWADNWFEMHVNGKKILEDSVPITTEKSFNSESKSFFMERPALVAFKIKDFKENDTGLEYIGSDRQQIGDGGFIAQISDNASGSIVAVSDKNMKCLVIHKAPLDEECANEKKPVAGQAPCLFKEVSIPKNWKSINFDDSSWPYASEFSAYEVRPKDGFEDIKWNTTAKLIWTSDLKKDNTLLCRLKISPGIKIKKLASERCETVKRSIKEAGFDKIVDVICSENSVKIISETFPEHEMMVGISKTNEQIPVPAVSYVVDVPANPSLTNAPLTRDSALGVAVNGVPIFDYTGGGEMSEKDLHHHQTQHDTVLTKQLDKCGGHAGRGDDYHYHKRPNCMIDSMSNQKRDDKIIGWAFDGFPIYDSKNPDGSDIKIGELDICNGKVDPTFGYRYHTSLKHPYIIQCLMGRVDNQAHLPRVAPLVSTSNGGKAAGLPPEGEVEDLTFKKNEKGKVSMNYNYKNENYFINYEPSDKPNCYKFESKTITNKHILETGEYCRK